jgi:hypothetical protein
VLLDDYGVWVAARLRIDGADPELIVPGSYTIGEQTGTIALRGIGGAAAWGEARVVAKLDWLGPGSDAVLTPIEHGVCRVNGQPVERAVRLVAGSSFQLGALTLHLEYPG